MKDVIIIGGGPAGSTAATLLAKKGLKVTLFEKEWFPREHVGESLLPYCYQILDELGVLPRMENAFVRKPGVRFIDVDGSHNTTWCFGHVIKDPSFLSFHVIRAEFDQLLLENAKEKGVDVHEGTRVTAVDLEDPNQVRVDYLTPENKTESLTAGFLIDASGRDTFLANKMGSKTAHPELRRAALSTHWSGAKYIAGIEEGLLQIVYLGGRKKGWIWMIPVGRDRLSVGVVLDNDYLRERRAEFREAGVQDWQEKLYREEVFSSSFAAQVLSDAEILQPLMFNGNYSYTVSKKYASNFALIGDSATFIDPIFASGVFLSMKSASLVSEALVASKANGGSESNLEAAYGQINGAYRLIDKAIRMFYNPEAINLAQIGSATQLIHQKHEDAMAIGHYLLAGDFFKNFERYSNFIDMLQDEKVFEGYKNLVINRSDFQSDTCGMERSQIFAHLLEEQDSRV